MKRTGELDHMFLLSCPGKWELVRRDAGRETVESDGTRVVDMRGYAFAMPVEPSREELQNQWAISSAARSAALKPQRDSATG